MSEHLHTHATSSGHLMLAIGSNLIIVVTEVVFGLLSHSMALLSEALHNFTDIGSLVLSLWGERVIKKPHTTQKTFGYKRTEVIIAFTNGAILLGVSGWVLVESILRIFRPEPIASMTMLIVAVISLLGNGFGTYILEKDAKKNLSLKSAWLHSLQDALFSLSIIFAAIIIYYTGWNWIDPAISIIISIFLLKEVFNIITESVNMLLDSVPVGIDFEVLKRALLAIRGVEEINDLHIWQTGSHDKFISAHVLIHENAEKERLGILIKARGLLESKFGIHHQTLQLVTTRELQRIGFQCEHCN